MRVLRIDPARGWTTDRARDAAVLVAAAALLLAASGCRGGAARGRLQGDVYTQGRHERFRIAAPATPWQPIDAPGADLAWHHPGAEAVIAASGVCRGHRDPPLKILVNDLLLGTTGRRVLLEEDAVLDGRAARHAVVEARLDGVPLVYDLYVYKKDGCVYDLWLVTPPAAYEGVADAFVSFVARFRGLGGDEG